MSAWLESPAGTFVRSLDGNEALTQTTSSQFFHLHRENWIMSVILNLKTSHKDQIAAESALRTAWIKLRHRYPHIASLVDTRNMTFTYKSPCSKDCNMEKWLEESFQVHIEESVDQVIASAKFQPYSALHVFRQTSRVLFCAHHSLVDGIGALHLVNQLLVDFAGDNSLAPIFGDETEYLTPALPNARGPSVHERDSVRSDALKEEAKVFVDEWAQHFPSLCLPTATPQTPGEAKVQCVTFDETELQNLLNACRQRGYTLTSAVQSALILAIRQVAEPQFADRDYVSVSFHDYRKQLPAPYNDSSRWPMGMWMVGIPYSLPQMDFDIQAEASGRLYHDPYKPKSDFLDFCLTVADIVTTFIGGPQPEGARPSSIPQLSSIGLIDNIISKEYVGKGATVKVDFVQPVLGILTSAPLVMQWSFDGIFYISVSYNDAAQSDAFMQDFVHRISKILRDALLSTK